MLYLSVRLAGCKNQVKSAGWIANRREFCCGIYFFKKCSFSAETAVLAISEV